jgi:hypothetical protein
MERGRIAKPLGTVENLAVLDHYRRGTDAPAATHARPTSRPSCSEGSTCELALRPRPCTCGSLTRPRILAFSFSADAAVTMERDRARRSGSCLVLTLPCTPRRRLSGRRRIEGYRPSTRKTSCYLLESIGTERRRSRTYRGVGLHARTGFEDNSCSVTRSGLRPLRASVWASPVSLLNRRRSAVPCPTPPQPGDMASAVRRFQRAGASRERFIPTAGHDPRPPDPRSCEYRDGEPTSALSVGAPVLSQAPGPLQRVPPDQRFHRDFTRRGCP